MQTEIKEILHSEIYHFHGQENGVNSRWVTDLNIKAKIIYLLEENVREYLHELKVGKDLCERIHTQKTLVITGKVDKMDFIKTLLRKLKSSLRLTENVIYMFIYICSYVSIYLAKHLYTENKEHLENNKNKKITVQKLIKLKLMIKNIMVVTRGKDGRW